MAFETVLANESVPILYQRFAQQISPISGGKTGRCARFGISVEGAIGAVSLIICVLGT